MSATQLRLAEGTFRAFGSDCRVVCDIEHAVWFAIDRLEDLECRWSRFRENSEVNHVNRHAGQWCEVSAATAQLFGVVANAVELSNGVVNPLMLRQIEALGYGASHESLIAPTDAPSISATAMPSKHTPSDRLPAGCTPASASMVEVEGGAVRIPAGTGFDPGGFGKGLAADLVAADLVERGASWAMVSLGGDIRFAGSALAEVAPLVHVNDVRSPDGILGTTRVAGGALASSSTTVRRWMADGQVRHHLLDPRTGAPVRSPRIAATVYAPSAWLADVIAKALIIDPTIGRTELEQWSAEALAFTTTDVEDLGLPVHPGGAM